ncbi:hypothetical protein FB192DRAFT_1314461 [Mucor lusitanicus]|uniref:SH3 domain-containing protein n=1 Tax=Mucor circinelloides f. lusitanicus TaxID=29924 RepID=A0A8H4B824_MUCCL|nr:hypothetical protein FB192DRAFT_1314461 [Mucor lusitanicus]
MPPNVQQEQAPVSFIDHFWSKDKSGMDKLFNYIQTTHQDLEMIYSIYVERSAMEQEFGQRLLALSRDQEARKDDKAQGVVAAYHAVSEELKQTATTHLELSDRLKHQVATECQNKLTEYRGLLSKWTAVLEELYQDRKEKTMELLKIRAKYLKEHDIAKGQSTPTMEALKNQYKTMVIKVDEVAQEWNSTWREACEVLEAMEEDRVEFLKNNVWEYANLASATLLVQDECCENIRKQLEVCHVEQEIERCIALYATGSKMPTTNEYVGELMREQKKKHQAERAAASENAPKPPNNMGSTATRGQVKRKPLNKSLMEQVSSEMAIARSSSSSSSSSSTHASSTTQEDHPNAVVSEEAKYRRQPSEYKPDAGSIPSRRFASNNKSSNHHVLKQVVDTPSAFAAPKSPRPPAQQITRDQQEGYHHNNSAPLSMYAQPQPAVLQQQPSPHLIQQALPEQNTGYAPQPNSAYIGHHTYQQQQQQHYMGAPQNMAQAPMQQQRSPMMQPQRSPMMQPQRSPMMQPIHSPMMQPMHSPMMQPLHSPMMQQRGTLPPPITIPNTTTTTNFAMTPQPSPSMSYSNLGGVSPGGILPPPTSTQQYRPLQYTDGRPIQFWARAKYDYDAKDADELSFKANNLMGILEADMTQQSWWVGAIYDEYRQTWSLAASIPSNFMNSTSA